LVGITKANVRVASPTHVFMAIVIAAGAIHRVQKSGERRRLFPK